MMQLTVISAVCEQDKITYILCDAEIAGTRHFVRFYPDSKTIESIGSEDYTFLAESYHPDYYHLYTFPFSYDGMVKRYSPKA